MTIKATSPYLNLPPRTIEQAAADLARTAQKPTAKEPVK